MYSIKYIKSSLIENVNFNATKAKSKMATSHKKNEPLQKNVRHRRQIDDIRIKKAVEIMQ